MDGVPPADCCFLGVGKLEGAVWAEEGDGQMARREKEGGRAGASFIPCLHAHTPVSRWHCRWSDPVTLQLHGSHPISVA